MDVQEQRSLTIDAKRSWPLATRVLGLASGRGGGGMTKKQLIGARSRSKTYHSRGLWAVKARNGGTFPQHPKQDKPAAPVEKPSKYYPAEDAPKPLKFRHKIRPTKLRTSITPGTVLILLAGRFKGKRVVFLKQLESGLLLVTGPYVVNGVPLRRVNQAYAIATSTKIDISALDCSKIADDYFKHDPAAKEAKEKAFPTEKKEQQKALDSKLLPEIEKLPELKSYLGARFSLQRGMKPHQLVF